ncbi:hypothetical protein E2C01_017580 [Portunus trituberculatus]|nr:hypothetical protein [Portunus trituberculatus]
MVVVVAAAALSSASSHSCNTFCDDPDIDAEGHYVCCDSYPGTCPPIVFCNYGQRRCHYDGQCGPGSKCCDSRCGKRCIAYPPLK